MKLALLFLVFILSTCSGHKNSTRSTIGVDEYSDSKATTDETSIEDSVRYANGKLNESHASLKSILPYQDANSKGVTSTNPDYIDSMQDSDKHLKLLVQDFYSGIETSETRIIEDAKSLQQFYSIINRTRKPGLPVPDIDFVKERVIIRCSGITKNGSYPNISVQNETEEELILEIEQKEPSMKTSAITTPFSIYKLAVTGKRLIIRD